MVNQNAYYCINNTLPRPLQHDGDPVRRNARYLVDNPETQNDGRGKHFLGKKHLEGLSQSLEDAQLLCWCFWVIQ